MKILATGDMHLREDTPVCRTDDYQKAQYEKLSFIKNLRKQNQAMWVDAGDIFDGWKPSPGLLFNVIEALDDIPMISVPGNHDLPQHNLELVDRSGYGVLEAAHTINNYEKPNLIIEMRDTVFVRVPWGCNVPQLTLPKYKHKFKVLVYHHLVYEGKPPYPGAEKEGNTAKALLNKYPEYNLIITGHNHQTCIERVGDRLLINPGSMMRMTAAQIDHKPSVFVFDTDTLICNQYSLPIVHGVVSRDHIEASEYKDERVNAFLERLRDDVEMKLSFRDNLNRYIADNDIRDAVKEKIMEVLDVE